MLDFPLNIRNNAGKEDFEYAVDKHPWHRTWRSLFYRNEPLSVLASAYGIPGETARNIVDIVAAYSVECAAIDERVEEADQEPLTGWDAIAYADYRWETPILSPLDGLSSHLGYVSFDRAWEKIIRCTRATDLDGLIQWGRAHAAAEFSDSIRDEDVIIPADVRASWSHLHATST